MRKKKTERDIRGRCDRQNGQRQRQTETGGPRLSKERDEGGVPRASKRISKIETRNRKKRYKKENKETKDLKERDGLREKERAIYREEKVKSGGS